jgi:carboxyl-terminal processing protease
MKRRSSRLNAVCAAVVVLASLAGGLWSGRAKAGSAKDLSDELRLYTAILGTIEREYVDEIKSEQLVAASVNAMLETLDPHSHFLEPRAHTSLQERQHGSYYGLGITVQSVDGNITVVAPFEGTPAHRLGIRAGDVISQINGENARGMGIDDAVRRLRGPKGTTVKVAILRQGYDEPLEFNVIRDEITLHAVPYSFMINPTTGYVRLVDFNEMTACRAADGPSCERELERAIRKLRSVGATGLILDIRDNPGGLLDQASAVSSLFLQRGQLVVFTRGRGRNDALRYVTEGDSHFDDMPLVVLVSQHSASASEIVAGAIQDHDRGLIVGERTFGKGLVQTIMPLRNGRGYALTLTTARYYTPSGRSIQRAYGGEALEDYHAPLTRRGCDSTQGEAKLTDSGRRVYGGDGITPDYCVEPAPVSKFVSYLDTRRVFFDFSTQFEAAAINGKTSVGNAGTRSTTNAGKLKYITHDFNVDDRVLADFKGLLELRKLRFTEDDLMANREELKRHILEETLRQVFGEGVARQRTLQGDAQLRKALDVLPQAEILLRDPKRYVADRAGNR